MPWLALTTMLLQTLGQALLSPFFWLVVLLVAVQHYRLARHQGRLLGAPTEPPWLPILAAAALGLAGGGVGSALLILLGVSFTNMGLTYLWPLAILLMLVSPHLLCFSYAGGLLSLSSLFFGFPRLEVPQLMALVGALHLVESLLILASGHLGAVPVYLRLPDGRVAGAFNLQRFWPIPLVGGALVTVPYLPPGALPMPDWWPLIRPAGLADLSRAVYVILPVVAALGYGDVALASLPRRKSRRSALVLLGYSLVVLALAVGASHYYPLAYLAAAFAPLGHELTIYLGRRAELRGRPIFLSPPDGVMVLATAWGSPARRGGLPSGSVLRAVNGRPVASRAELVAALEEAGPVLEVEFTAPAGEWRRTTLKRRPGQPLGLILAPEPGDLPTAELRATSLFRRLFRK